MEQVVREIVVDAGCEDVWDAVTSDEMLSEWFGGDGTAAIEPGEVLRSDDGRRAVIERADAPHRLTFRWIDEVASRVEIAIDEVEEGSRVRVVERRIEAAVSPTPRLGFKALVRT
jgi:uncharacterized protein YndB with AHSA1/START domain